ncbi:MAG TPA: hypothetical protein VFQ59_01810 [Candidatus Paceibacterota bacterium]|nr:hypothetical protein [Candidatus Paceibacterota bacterium]
MEYKIIIGTIAVAIQLGSYAIYFHGIWKGKTKPHAFTWLVWGILSAVGFAAVAVSGGEAGSWILAVNTVACLTIAGIGFKQKRVHYDLYDWLALVGALIGILLWWFTKNPLYAVILVALSDIICAIPTIRKAYRLPFEENAISFSIGIFYYPLSILALETLSVTTWLYPVSITFIDIVLVAIILIRRKKLGRPVDNM